MSKKVTLSEEQLTKVIKNILEQDLNGDETLFNIDDVDVDVDIEGTEENEDKLSDLEDEIEQILSPEEIMGLMEEQIVQLQDRTQYMEELNADVLEFTSFLMDDLERSDELNLKKSKQKLRALETRAGRETYCRHSRRC